MGLLAEVGGGLQRRLWFGIVPALRARASEAVLRHFPGAAKLYSARDWSLPDGIDRVYVNARAPADLGWRPMHDFARVLESLGAGEEDFRSPLARAVGSKGYHEEVFADGPYPVTG